MARNGTRIGDGIARYDLKPSTAKPGNSVRSRSAMAVASGPSPNVACSKHQQHQHVRRLRRAPPHRGYGFPVPAGREQDSALHDEIPGRDRVERMARSMSGLASAGSPAINALLPASSASVSAWLDPHSKARRWALSAASRSPRYPSAELVLSDRFVRRTVPE